MLCCDVQGKHCLALLSLSGIKGGEKPPVASHILNLNYLDAYSDMYTYVYIYILIFSRTIFGQDFDGRVRGLLQDVQVGRVAEDGPMDGNHPAS